MEKLGDKSMNIVAENIIKMKELFPEVFCENKIDFEKLKQVLGEYTEDKEERYSFNWKGKSKAIRLSQTSSTGTLRPCKEESKNFDATKNLYIEGDNLEVLKLLQKTYNSKVKMIYIDPPYNTGNDFVYHDNFRDNIKNYLEITGQVDAEGRKLGTNSEASGRYHTDWLNMMYPRLKLARNLLSDDGVIFISIDDNEIDNLKKICNEIFGENNFLGHILWQKKTSPQNDAKKISPTHDHILLYCKDFSHYKLILLPRNEESIKKFKNPDNDFRGVWTAGDLSSKTKAPEGKSYLPPVGRQWAPAIETFERLSYENRIYYGKDNNSQPKQKQFLNEIQQGIVPTTIWFSKEVGDNTLAVRELRTLGIDFDSPKPVSLIIRTISLGILYNEKSIVLDFFSGSSTTAHAVMQLNAQDGGNRKFIMVQLPKSCDEKSEAYVTGYKNICEIGKERIRRAGEKIVKENKDKEGVENLDIGFKVFKLDSSNIKKWNVDGENLEISIDNMIDNFVPNRTEEDIVYEIMIKYGIDLTYPVEMRRISDKKVFIIGIGALFICLDNEITLEVVEGIVKFKEELNPEITRVVLKDNGFKSDSVKTNAIQILRRNKIQEIMSI